MDSEISASPRPTGKGLLDNIVRFADYLRNHAVTVSLPGVLDTFRGLPLIDISNPRQFRCLLRANLVSRRPDMAPFDKLFKAYWLPQVQRRPPIRSDEPAPPEEEPGGTMSGDFEDSGEARPPRPREPVLSREWSLRYSPDSLSGHVDIRKFGPVDFEAMTQAVKDLLKPLDNRLSRRFRYTVHGREISLRRMLRKNMQFGGELIFLDFKKKKVKKRRVVFFCDVSGSMDIYTRMILQFIHALRQIDRRTEIFLFATGLSRVTGQFNDHDFHTAIARIPELISDWGGGTRTGRSLQMFNDTYGARLLSGRDIVIIFSDGWDRGEIDVLEAQMSLLKRKAYKIIWLNPLLGTKGYQPICQGMRTALPYVDSFLPMDNPHDLQRLSRTLEKIAG